MLGCLGGSGGTHNVDGVIVNVAAQRGQSGLEAVDARLQRVAQLSESGAAGRLILERRNCFIDIFPSGTVVVGSGILRRGRSCKASVVWGEVH